jgi:hypothetical protein
MSVIGDALGLCRARVRELEGEIAALDAERERLERVIDVLTDARPQRAGLPAARAGGQGVAVAARPRRRRRAPRGQNRRMILAAIEQRAKTAAEIARETGIKPTTVAYASVHCAALVAARMRSIGACSASCVLVANSQAFAVAVCRRPRSCARS